MHLKLFFSSLLVASAAMTTEAITLVDGGVYQITNHHNQLVIQAPESPGIITIQNPDETNPNQLWVAHSNADGTAYYLRGLANGYYMTSPIQTSARWTTTLTASPDEDSMSFIFNDNNTIQAVGFNPDEHPLQAGYAHANGSAGTQLQCWGPASEGSASRWTLTLVDMDAATLESYQDAWYPRALRANRVYQFINNLRGGAFHAVNGEGNVTCITPDTADESQLWITESNADGTGFFLRNLISGLYLNSPMRTQAYWTCTPYPCESTTLLTIEPQTEEPDLFAIGPKGVAASSRNFAHEDDQHRLYSWDRDANASKWAVQRIEDYDDAAIEAVKATWPDSPLTEVIDGKVYRLTNANYTGRSLSHNNNNAAIGEETDDNSLRQLWLVESNADGTGFMLRNFDTGSVLQSSMGRSTQWKVVNTSKPNEAKTVMYVEIAANGVVLQPLSVKNSTGEAKNYGYAHEDGNHNIVGWESSAKPTQWTLTMVNNFTDEEIEAQRQTWEYVKTDNIEATLAAMFTDKTCTELNSTYSAMSAEDIEADARYQSLPATLRQMVMKVRTGDWSETDPVNAEIQWDSEHARKFRVQMVEPYSNCDGITGMTCIQAYTNFNNPTGILSDNGTTLYVMVEKGAPEGSTLYIAPRTFESSVNKLNVVNDGTELTEGLNIIQCNEDCAEMVVYYVVNTNSGRTRLHPLTDYDDIKIHVEGGSINGFFNAEGDALYTPDTNEDWFYYRERARHPRFSIISKYCLLYMHFFDVEGNSNPCLKNLLTRDEYNAGNFDLIATLRAWDEMFVAEMLIMGLMSDDVILAEKAAGRDWYDTLEGDEVAPSDYSLYFNNRLMGISSTEGFMSATWYRSTYNISTLRSIIMQFPTMDLWGPAHEFGHLNQGPMKIAGTSEESNNVFSNVALFYRGVNSSRASLPSVQRDFFNRGYNFHQHDTWGTTRMWFQLWLYYHAAGNNKKFYPRLYELLRENPLQKNSTEHLNAKDDLLHFAKMCCIAAGEDLTDFFEAWGFFVEQDGFYIGDYTSYTSYLSAEDIAEWKADIKQMAEENGWEKNNAVIFIDDRVGSTKQAYADWCRPADAGEMGGLNDFIEGRDAVSGEYEFSVSGTAVTVGGDGTGGVGFLIYDEEGKLIGFSNEKTFEVSAETAKKIAEGKASFSVIQSNNVEVPVRDAVREGSLESRLTIIADLLERAEDLLSNVDPTSTKVGYLKPEVADALIAARDEVKAKFDNNEITEENATELYDLLNPEVLAVETITPSAENIINIVPNNIYSFTANQLKGIYGVRTGDNNNNAVPVAVAENVNKNDELQQWYFIPADENGSFFIQNVSNHKYLKLADADNSAMPLTSEPEQSWTIQPLSLKFVAVVANSDAAHNAIHADNNGRIVRWEPNASASLWTLELADDSESKSLIFALNDIIAKAEALLPEAGTVESTIRTEPVDITPDDLFTNAPCKVTQWGDGFTDETWSYLFDDDAQTIFHSDYSDEGTTDGLNHYISIRIPENCGFFNQFVLGYRTRYQKANAQVFSPRDVTLACSPDGETWTDVANITSGLTTAFSTDQALDPCSLTEDAKYIRFMVNHANPDDSKAGHNYFVISELRLSKAFNVAESATPVEKFTFVEPEMLMDVYNNIEAAKLTIANPGATNPERTEAINSLTEAYTTLLNAMNRNIERLRELIAQTRALAAELGENTENVIPLSVSADQYSTNAEYTGQNTSDHLSSWEVLFDNNPNTFFHSTYNSNTTDDNDHHIQIRLQEPTTATETDMLLTYTTRNHNSNTFAPAEAIIEYSADGETWTVARELDNLLPLTHNTSFESETFSVPAGTQFVRFTVSKSRQNANSTNRGTSNGHDYFAVSEFVLCEYDVESEPDTESWPDANAETLEAAIRQIHNSEVVINASRADHSNFDASYDALLPHYQALLAIKNNPSTPTMIDEIESTKGETVIYNLQGLRISRISSPGIYIINGKKTLVR